MKIYLFSLQDSLEKLCHHRVEICNRPGVHHEASSPRTIQGQVVRSQAEVYSGRRPPGAGKDGMICGIRDTREVHNVRPLCAAHLGDATAKITMTI